MLSHNARTFGSYLSHTGIYFSSRRMLMTGAHTNMTVKMAAMRDVQSNLVAAIMLASGPHLCDMRSISDEVSMGDACTHRYVAGNQTDGLAAFVMAGIMSNNGRKAFLRQGLPDWRLMGGVTSPTIAASAAAVLTCSVWALCIFCRRQIVHGRCEGRMLPCDHLQKRFDCTWVILANLPITSKQKPMGWATIIDVVSCLHGDM